ncbi:hypothetical protein HAX54_022023 [Datura stramonium]|uniref:Uncharacterized protein n=1 Tax=Datura stramonium TaxID=4076 RepID=A0ABS8UVP3_DATST|nr:hypothetical protein [Datura stramonium]
MAWAAEYVIDSCLACSHPLWYKVLWISEVVENINLKNKVVSDAFGRKKKNVTVHKIAKTSMNIATSLSAKYPRVNEAIEGLNEAMNKIKKQLLGGSSQLDIISIVGRGYSSIFMERVVATILNEMFFEPAGSH